MSKTTAKKTKNWPSVLNKIKDFIHPANVSWKSPKSTTHDTIVVLAFVAVASAVLAGFDVILGATLNLMF